jgi:phosphopantothenoylcysteine decarboxylase/phosphopantothenate--cysteine ligase
MAVAARDAGADVILVTGPVNLPKPAGMRVIEIESAEQLLAATHDNLQGIDIFIAAAAVADYRPVKVESRKIKKTDDELLLALVRAPDILASVAALDEPPFCVGFAAETDKVEEYARRKLQKKKLAMIIANKVGTKLGFDSDDNAVDVYWQGGDRHFPTTDKSVLAVALVGLIAERYHEQTAHSASADQTVTAD